MHDKTPYLLFASAAALSLALSQTATAQTSTAPAAQAPVVVAPPAPLAANPAPAAPAAAPAPVQPAPAAAAPSPAPVAATVAPAGAEGAPSATAAAHADAAAKRMEERRAEMMAKRKQRYEELRKRAETAGLNLPESPPWDEAGFTPPEMPEMPEMPAWASPSGMEGMDQEWMARREQAMQAMQAMRERAKQRASAEGPDQAPWNLETAEERRAQMEKMRNATPEERAALRDQHWAEMRERAATQGITMPETSPWKEAEQRREARKAQWENYRKIIDQMSAEEREAAEAMFGQPPMPPMDREMSPPMPYGQDFGAPPARPYPPTNPGFGGPGYQGQGQTMPWSGGYPAQMPAPMMMPNSGYNRW